jgi:hypothetical protein
MPANWEEADRWLASGALQRLVVSCPRCKREGAVEADGHGEYRIEWRDERSGWTWHDEAVTPDELRSPDFGCGHDRRVAGGFVGNAPR